MSGKRRALSRSRQPSRISRMEACFDSDAEAEDAPWKPGGRCWARHGSLADIMGKLHLPKGPKNVRELFGYPADIVNICFADAEREHRARALLAAGVCETSDYSGTHSEGEAKRLLFAAITSSRKWEPALYRCA